MEDMKLELIGYELKIWYMYHQERTFKHNFNPYTIYALPNGYSTSQQTFACPCLSFTLFTLTLHHGFDAQLPVGPAPQNFDISARLPVSSLLYVLLFCQGGSRKTKRNKMKRSLREGQREHGLILRAHNKRATSRWRHAYSVIFLPRGIVSSSYFVLASPLAGLGKGEELMKRDMWHRWRNLRLLSFFLNFVDGAESKALKFNDRHS